MRSLQSFVRLTLLALSAGALPSRSVLAQGPADHWLTTDSLAVVLALTPQQQLAVAVHYDSLNAVLSRAIALRTEWRSHAGHQVTVSQKDAYRHGMAQALATVTSEWAALRALLPVTQQVKLDALPKPPVDTVGPRSAR